MSTPAEIPGFYYDSEKKKYFKIQAHAPSGSAYSSQDVKRRKINDEEKTAQFLKVQRNVGRIRRAEILGAPIIRGLLSNEFGRPSSKTITTSFYVENLVCAEYYSFHGTFRPPIFVALSPRSDSSVRVAIVIRDRIQYSLFRGVQEADGQFMNNSMEMSDICTSSHFFRGQAALSDEQRVTSISVNEGVGHVVATWQGASSDRGVVISRYPEDSADPDGNNGALNSSEIILGPGTTRGHVDILSSTSAPPNSQYAFAIGSSNGILMIDKNFDMSWLRRKTEIRSELYRDHPRYIYSLEYCQNHKDILLAGNRVGALNIIDLRQPQFGSTADIIQHTSCIVHIKSLDEHRILAAGAASDLCQYDRRFIKQDAHHPRGGNSTRSYLSYPGYSNYGHMETGLAIDLDLGIIANTDRQTLQLFSLHEGHCLSNHKNPVRNWGLATADCVQFVQDHPNNPKSLWVASLENYILRLSLGRREVSSPQARDPWPSEPESDIDYTELGYDLSYTQILPNGQRWDSPRP